MPYNETVFTEDQLPDPDVQRAAGLDPTAYRNQPGLKIAGYVPAERARTGWTTQVGKGPDMIFKPETTFQAVYHPKQLPDPARQIAAGLNPAKCNPKNIQPVEAGGYIDNSGRTAAVSYEQAIRDGFPAFDSGNLDGTVDPLATPDDVTTAFCV